MQKNVASQKLIVFAFDSTTNLPKTGDAANITAYVSIDYGAVTVLGDTSATEMDATNAKGYYLFDLTQAETNGHTLLFSAKSSTSNIVVIGVPATTFTVPANFALESIDSNGRVDVIKVAGTTQTARDIGASVLLSSGTGTGQLDITSGVVKANLVQILATALTETAGQLAGGFKKFFDVAAPTGTLNSLPAAIAGAANGLFIAGTNAATSITTALTANIIGNVTGSLSGSVGSVTGAVGSVTAAVTITAASIQAIWDALTSALTTVGSIGKLIVDNLNATISSRMATYTQPTGFLSATFPSGTVANTTNITAGVITTTTNLTNAPTAGDFTATMKTSLNAATPAVTVSDKTGFSLSAAGIQAIWDALTAALTTVGSIGKLLVDNINATISSRLASASYTTPPTTAQIADKVLGRSIQGGADGGRTVMDALRILRNRRTIAAGTLTAYQEDDATPAWTAAVATAAGNPVSDIDPA